MTEDSANLVDLAQERLQFGRELLQQLDSLKLISGVAKIRKKVCSEMAFLAKVTKV